MREKRSGTIINISSLGAVNVNPGSGYYSLSVFLAVITARSPFSNTAFSIPLPIPLELPVINHVFIILRKDIKWC